MFKEEIISNLYKVFQKTEQERNITLILESDQDNIHRSVSQFSCSVVSNSLQPHGLKHDRLPCPSPTPGTYSNSCPSHRRCHSTTSSSVVHSPPTCNLSQHQGLFQGVGSSHQVAKVVEFQLQHQSSQQVFRTDFL